MLDRKGSDFCMHLGSRMPRAPGLVEFLILKITLLLHDCDRSHFFKCMYWVMMGVTAGPRPDVRSVPARFAQVGFSFFVVIMIASYTAHLGALVLKEGQKNTWFPMNSIEEAAAKRASICIHHLVLPLALSKYPQAQFVAVDSSDEIPGMIYDKKCDAAGKQTAKSYVYERHLRTRRDSLDSPII